MIALATALMLVASDPSCLMLERGDGDSPVIRAWVNDQGPFAFVLDTASSGTTLDAPRIALLHPPREPAPDQAQGMGGAVQVDLYRIAAFDAGPVRMRDFVSPQIAPPAFDSHDIAGLAGVDLFGDAMAVWRPAQACVSVRPRGAVEAGWTPVRTDWQRPWRILLPLRIGRTDGWALLDTGAQHTTLNPAFATALGLQTDALPSGGQITGVDGAPLELHQAQIPAAQVGRWRWRAVPVKIGALPVFDRLGSPDQPMAILGVDWLGDRGFAIDYGARKVWQTTD